MPTIKGATVTGTAPEGLLYVHDLLSVEEQQDLLRLVRTLSYKHEMARGRPMKRGQAHFGYAYATAGRKLAAAPPWPDPLVALGRKVLVHCPTETPFNQCIVTYYPTGAGMGWHRDADLFADCIAIVSLGGTARLQFRPEGSNETRYELSVAPGSLYVMRGPARWVYEHHVPAVKAERYSVAFREVIGANDGETSAVATT